VAGSAPGVLAGLGALASASLLLPLAGADDEPRYRLLETIREYALERLEAQGEAEEIGRRHAAYFLALAEEAEPRLAGTEQWAWLDRELGNLRAALAWARTVGALELGLRLAVALANFWEERGHVREGREWLESLVRGLAARDDRPRLATLCARALATTAWMAFLQGDYDGAAESLALYRELGDGSDLAYALGALAGLAADRGEVERARALCEDSVSRFRQLGDARGLAVELSLLGRVTALQGDDAGPRRPTRSA
jgi:hypothetical protein